jgi:hypothetical protein
MIETCVLTLYFILLAGLAAAEQQLVVTPSSADANYAIGDQITWSVQADDSGVPVDKVAYVEKCGGLRQHGSGCRAHRRLAELDQCRRRQGRDQDARDGPLFRRHDHRFRLTCPALIGYGLIETASRAEGVIATINTLRGPVEPVQMINAGHGGKHDAYCRRDWAWKVALRTGKAPPIPAR